MPDRGVGSKNTAWTETRNKVTHTHVRTMDGTQRHTGLQGQGHTGCDVVLGHRRQAVEDRKRKQDGEDEDRQRGLMMDRKGLCIQPDMTTR